MAPQRGTAREMGVLDWGEEEFQGIQLVSAPEQPEGLESSEDAPW